MALHGLGSRRLAPELERAFHHASPAQGSAAEPLLSVVRSVDALVSVFIEGTDPMEAVDAGGLSDAEAARLAQAVMRIPLRLAPRAMRPRPTR